MARKNNKMLKRKKSLVKRHKAKDKPKPKPKPKAKAKRRKLTDEEKANMRVYNKKYQARKSKEPGWLAAQCAAVKVNYQRITLFPIFKSSKIIV